MSLMTSGLHLGSLDISDSILVHYSLGLLSLVSLSTIDLLPDSMMCCSRCADGTVVSREGATDCAFLREKSTGWGDLGVGLRPCSAYHLSLPIYKRGEGIDVYLLVL